MQNQVSFLCVNNAQFFTCLLKDVLYLETKCTNLSTVTTESNKQFVLLDKKLCINNVRQRNKQMYKQEQIVTKSNSYSHNRVK